MAFIKVIGKCGEYWDYSGPYQNLGILWEMGKAVAGVWKSAILIASEGKAFVTGEKADLEKFTNRMSLWPMLRNCDIDCPTIDLTPQYGSN